MTGPEQARDAFAAEQEMDSRAVFKALESMTSDDLHELMRVCLTLAGEARMVLSRR